MEDLPRVRMGLSLFESGHDVDLLRTMQEFMASMYEVSISIVGKLSNIVLHIRMSWLFAVLWGRTDATSSKSTDSYYIALQAPLSYNFRHGASFSLSAQRQ